MKHCPKCEKTKSPEEFNRCSNCKDGRQSRCRECESQYRIDNAELIKARGRKHVKNREVGNVYINVWREKNPERARESRKEYEKENLDKILAQKREYYARTKDERRAYQQEWNRQNAEKMKKYRREYMKEYRKTNPNYAIRHRTSNRIRDALITGKQLHTEEYIGCTIEELKTHLQSCFTDGMTWERFLAGDIHIDHIKPCCSFDLTDPEQQKICFHWTNLCPLWKEDNQRKLSQDLAQKRKKRPNSRVSS
jgi:hypothetical protein